MFLLLAPSARDIVHCCRAEVLLGKSVMKPSHGNPSVLLYLTSWVDYAAKQSVANVAVSSYEATMAQEISSAVVIGTPQVGAAFASPGAA